jgi:hypothetical protein
LSIEGIGYFSLCKLFYRHGREDMTRLKDLVLVLLFNVHSLLY